MGANYKTRTVPFPPNPLSHSVPNSEKLWAANTDRSGRALTQFPPSRCSMNSLKLCSNKAEVMAPQNPALLFSQLPWLKLSYSKSQSMTTRSHQLVTLPLSLLSADPGWDLCCPAVLQGMGPEVKVWESAPSMNFLGMVLASGFPFPQCEGPILDV